MRNNHFPEKHAFSRCGTTIFEKNMRSAGAEQLFSKKTNVPRGWTTVFRKRDSYSELKSATKWRYMLYIRVRET